MCVKDERGITRTVTDQNLGFGSVRPQNIFCSTNTCLTFNRNSNRYWDLKHFRKYRGKDMLSRKSHDNLLYKIASSHFMKLFFKESDHSPRHEMNANFSGNELDICKEIREIRYKSSHHLSIAII